MSSVASESLLLTFLLFCRVGGCLMVMPGFASTRIPVQVRLFLAIAATLALIPVLYTTLQAAVPKFAAGNDIRLIFSETVIGVLIGAMGRAFFLALQFIGSAIAMFIGMGNLPGHPIEDSEPSPAVGTLITITATALFFITDQHWEVFRGLVASYTALPISASLDVQFNLVELTDAVSKAFVLALQIGSPFVIYALVINFMFGLANKLTPQIPVYFISLPFVVAGGLFLLYVTIGEFLRLFITGFASWLAIG